MGDIWTEATGMPDPQCDADFEKGFQVLMDDRKLSISSADRKSKGSIRKLFRRVCDLATTTEELLRATELAISTNAGFNYIVSVLTNSKIEEPGNGNGNGNVQYSETKESVVTSDKITPASEDDRTGKNYILLYRYLRNHPFFLGKEPILRLVFIDLLLDAAYSDHSTEWRGITVNLKRGQWVVTFRKIASDYGVGETTVRRWFKYMKDKEMVDLEVVTMKSSFVVAPPSAPPSAPHGARQDKFGVLVTICNYEKWQPETGVKVTFNVAPTSAPPVAGGGALQNKGITEEGITEEGKYLLDSVKKITAKRIFEIWEMEKGPLEPVRAPSPEKLGELIKHLNSLQSNDPEKAWVELIHKARSCHSEHRAFMNPYFFSKDITHIDQVLSGLYDRSFERSKNATRIERPGRGDAEEHGITGDKVARVKRLARIGKV